MTPNPSPTPKPEATPTTTTPAAELNADGTPKTAEAPKSETSKAPEAYAAFKVPEGFELTEPVAKQAGELFKGMNLTQDQAQSLVDFHTNALKDSVNAGETLMTEMRTNWRAEVMKDPNLGTGSALKPEVNATIGRALDGLGDAKMAADFREAMNLTGVGDNPAFIRAFYKLAQQVTEGKPVTGNGPTSQSQAAPNAGPKTAANAMYPNLP